MNVNKACNWTLIAMSVLAFNAHADEPRPEKAYSIGLHMNERLFSDLSSSSACAHKTMLHELTTSKICSLAISSIRLPNLSQP